MSKTGTRGPVPKRTEERRRRNAPEGPSSTYDGLEVEADIDPDSDEAKRARGLPIPEADENWHDIAKMAYESLQYSRQSVYMEASDWAQAYLLCESISRDLGEQVVGVTEDGTVVKDEIPLKGASLAAYLKGFGELGMSEGARRRMNMELKPRVGDGRKAPVRDIGSSRKARIG